MPAWPARGGGRWTTPIPQLLTHLLFGNLASHGE